MTNDLKPILGDALQSLKPNAEWAIHGDEITWIDKKQTQPTKAEIDAELLRLQEEYDSLAYSRARAESFPTWQEQMDMQYHDQLDGTTTWKDAVAKVKSDNPKE